MGELDLAIGAKVVDKSGAWFSFGNVRLGQGRENAKSFLRDNPDLAGEIEAKVLELERAKHEDAKQDAKKKEAESRAVKPTKKTPPAKTPPAKAPPAKAPAPAARRKRA